MSKEAMVCRGSGWIPNLFSMGLKDALTGVSLIDPVPSRMTLSSVTITEHGPVTHQYLLMVNRFVILLISSGVAGVRTAAGSNS